MAIILTMMLVLALLVLDSFHRLAFQAVLINHDSVPTIAVHRVVSASAHSWPRQSLTLCFFYLPEKDHAEHDDVVAFGVLTTGVYAELKSTHSFWEVRNFELNRGKISDLDVCSTIWGYSTIA